MKPIPQQVEPELLPYLDLKGRGKVCELYDLPDYFDLRFKVISDRVSVHDIILPFLIPGKGEVLNFVDHFWRSQFPEVRHDVVAIGSQVDQYLPARLRGRPGLYRQSRVITACGALPAELIWRSRLTGTGLKSYRQNKGVICGQQFPEGLGEWDKLLPSAFTPTTKDPIGHDEHMTVQEFIGRFGEGPMHFTRPVFEHGEQVAEARGIVIADTKFEVGRNNSGKLVLIDEVLTPDSSRYLAPEDLAEALRTGKRPPSFDKQPIRDYVLEHLGVGADTPLTDEVVAKVHGAIYPQWLIDETAGRYEELLKRLTGKTRDQYAEMLELQILLGNNTQLS